VANLVITAIFSIILLGVFVSSFTQAGVLFNTYSLSSANISQIESINGKDVRNATLAQLLAVFDKAKPDIKLDKINLTEIKIANKTYYGNAEIISQQLLSINENTNINKINMTLLLYDDSPAIHAKLKGVIKEINGVKIENTSVLETELLRYKPGDTIILTTTADNYTIKLGSSPANSTKAYLGIAFLKQERKGIFGMIERFVLRYREPTTYYEPKAKGIAKELVLFFYNLLLWIILINASVALGNMLPLGLFDGGRFFYLTVLAITGSKKKAKKAFSFVGYVLFLALVTLMIFWFLNM